MDYLDLMKNQIVCKTEGQTRGRNQISSRWRGCKREFILAVPVFADRRQHTRQSPVIDLWLLPV
jgi:hypothetical protein